MVNYTKLQAPVPLSIIGSSTVSASATAGQSFSFALQSDPTQPGTTYTYLTAPPTESWLVHGVESLSTPAIDGVVTWKVDNVDQNIIFGPLSVTLPTIYHQRSFKASYVDIGPTSRGQPYFVLAAANGTTTVTVNVQFYITRVPVGYKGPINL